ncbi:NADPH:adrenodoxin oxidoreductase, mitochondrial-like [Tubulanus polymorphus]|uniref:NADPH:adrenodoxin oxidoreductase, mitochondrial-like n=1 Tax=Tubulanus polymorphus TaxID=672921 RepID=UPI003DA35B05
MMSWSLRKLLLLNRLGVHRQLFCRRYSQESASHVAVVGSGPAGFYTAQQILKGNKNIFVDIYEKLPVPFGLVRFGVAPDHPEVKNVINTFTQTAGNKRCSFLGNVEIGKHISIEELRKAYSAVVFAYGASEDKQFGLPGEDLQGVHSARAFVGWYNGLPEDQHLEPDLTCTDSAVILGQGNVALDVARILLTPIDILAKTDISQHALEVLEKSTIKKVYLVGRRGPLQVAFTIKELREMVNLPGCRHRLFQQDYEGLEDFVKKIPRPRKRLTELLIKTALSEPTPTEKSRLDSADKEWYLQYKRSPVEFLPDGSGHRVGSVKFAINRLEGELGVNQKAVMTEDFESISCGLVLRSIGYKSIPLENLPFNRDRGIINHDGKGRVDNQPGVYCSGWVKRGPVGVILSTMTDGFETGKAIVSDIEKGILKRYPSDHSAKYEITSLLKEKGHQVVSFDDWEKIDQAEMHMGEPLGKPREKLLDISEMLRIAEQ